MKPTISIDDMINQVATWDNISIEIWEEWITINADETKEWVEIILNGHKAPLWEIPDNISDDFLTESLEQFSDFLDFLTDQLKEQQSEINRSINVEMDIDKSLSFMSKGTAEMIKRIGRTAGKVLNVLSFNSPNNVNNNMLNELVKYKSIERLKNEIDKLKLNLQEKLWEETNQLTNDLFSVIDDCLFTLQNLLNSQRNYINSQKAILYE